MPKRNSSALPFLTMFVHHENMVLWQMLWKASGREWDRLQWCYRHCWLAFYQRERGTSRSKGSSPGLSDSDVRKWFSGLKGNLIFSEKHLGQNISCIFYTAADYCWQNDTLQRSGLPLTPWGLLIFQWLPCGSQLCNNAKPLFTQSGEEDSLINECLRKIESICSGYSF